MDNIKGMLEKEAEEMKRFIAFLRNGNFFERTNEFERTPKCIHILKEFIASALESHGENLNHLAEINKNFRGYREHAIIDGCVGCMAALGEILTFRGYYNQYLFPKKIRKILSSEYSRRVLDKDSKILDLEDIFPIKLPAPTTGTFGPANGRLVYGTVMPILAAVDEFRIRIQEPLGLEGLTDFAVRKKKSPKGIIYFQADTHHKRTDWHTYISIRSRYETK